MAQDDPTPVEPLPVEETSPPPLLEYAPPKTPVTAARVFAGLFCIPMAIFAVPMLIGGVSGVIYGVSESHLRYRSEDTFKGVVMILTAGIAAWAAVRWGREAFLGDRRRESASRLSRFFNRFF